jgi:hypothetical protein
MGDVAFLQLRLVYQNQMKALFEEKKLVCKPSCPLIDRNKPYDWTEAQTQRITPYAN